MRHLETVLIAIYCLFIVVIYSYQFLVQITPKPIANSNKRVVLKQEAVVDSPTVPADGYQFGGGVDGDEEIYSEESNKEDDYEDIESTTTTTTPAPLLKCKNNNLIRELTPK